MKYTVLRNSFINGRSCMAGEEIELDEANKEYVEMLLSDGNVSKGTAGSTNRVPVEDPTANKDVAGSEATATPDPLVVGSDSAENPVPVEPQVQTPAPEVVEQPTASQIAKDVQLEDPVSNGSEEPKLDIQIQ